MGNRIYLLLNTIIRILFSFESAFLLFLLAGMYKADPRLTSLANLIKIDITVFFFLLSFYIGIIKFFKIFLNKNSINRYYFIYVNLYLIFSTFALFSLFYTVGYQYAIDKAFKLFILTGWAAIGVTITGFNRERTKRFLLLFVLFGLLISVDCIVQFFSIMKELGYTVRVGGLSAGYLGTSHISGLSFLIVLSNIPWIRNTKHRIISYFLLFVFLITVLINGGRAGVISTLIGVIVLLSPSFDLKSLKVHFQKWKKSIVFIVFIAIILIIPLGILGYFKVFFERTYLLFLKEESTYVRLEHYHKALTIWSYSPLLGMGIGSYPILIGLGDIQAYPHNLIIEVLCELGIIGFLLFIPVVLFPLYLISKVNYREDPIILSILVAFINILINSLFSGDINDNRLIFTFLGLLVSRCILNLKEYNKTNKHESIYNRNH